MMNEFALWESHEYGEPQQTVKANLPSCPANNQGQDRFTRAVEAILLAIAPVLCRFRYNICGDVTGWGRSRVGRPICE